MIAHHALKAALGPKPRYRVGSAGTLAVPQKLWAFVRDRLRDRNIDPAEHRPTRLTPEVLNAADLVIAMGLDHRDHIKECFGKDAVLFNQLCCGREESVLDVCEAVPDWQTDERANEAHAASVVDHICNAIPALIENIDKRFDRAGE